MTPERWNQIQEYLDVAVALEPHRRLSFLEELGCDDLELKKEIESLLAANNPEYSLLKTAAADYSTLTPTGLTCQPVVGRTFGPYRLIALLGEGGMGEVYRAVRADGQYEQEVALKIVRSGLGSEMMSRLRKERQILANLDHPNIAKILDGGTSENGVPYFVMEFIEGSSITEYCDQQRLSIAQRLRIFQTVCSAVHYAHQHLVVHRDIKPSNILVTASGTPKLLDFGIAKILTPDVSQENATLGFRMMTPEYASPEQLRGESITTATDVYSLGAVLYELLTGRRVYRGTSRVPFEVARSVLENEPEKPSGVVTRNILGEKEGKPSAESGPEEVSRLRRVAPENLRRMLGGDLDSIVLKALRKEPRERYVSADQLSEDIRRHAEGRPVSARKGSAAYHVRKYVLRHKAGVASVGLVFLSLVIGVLLTLREARIARANELRAERRFNDVRRLANSLLFDVHDSIQDLPGSTPARKLIVDRALQYLDSLAAEANSDPGLARELAAAYQRVGELQGHYLAANLGETSNSIASYQKALAIRRQLGERPNAEWQDRLNLAESYRRMASQLAAVSRIPEALTDIQSAIAITQSMAKTKPKDSAVLYELGFGYEILGKIQGHGYFGALGDLPAALKSYAEAAAIDRTLLGLDPDSLSGQRGLAQETIDIGNLLSDLRRFPEALESFNKALKLCMAIAQRTNAAKDRRHVAVIYNQIASTYDSIGNTKLMLSNHEKGLEIYKELAAEDPKNVLLQQGLAIAMVNTGESKSKLHRIADGGRYITQGIGIMNGILTNDPNSQERGILAQMHMSLADHFARSNRPSQGAREYGNAIQIFERMNRDSNNTGTAPVIATCRVRRGNLEMRAGNYPAAEADFQQVLDATVSEVEKNKPDAIRHRAQAYAGLGDIEAVRASRAAPSERQNHWKMAANWYEQSLEIGKHIAATGHTDQDTFSAVEVDRRFQNAKAQLRKT